jgi:hypothetical protein
MRASSYALKLSVFVLGATIWAHTVSAQALIDSAMGLSAGSDSELSNAAKAPPPTSMIMNGLERQGFTNISELAPTPIGQPMHATAVNPAGMPVDLIIDPKTGKLVSATPR